MEGSNERALMRSPCVDPEGGGGQGSGSPPGKHKAIGYFFLQYWSGSPRKLQSYQASSQCSAIIGPPAKRHLNGISLEGR